MAATQQLLTGGTVIDATGADPIDDAGVLVEGDRIVEVGPAEGIDAGPDCEEIDVGGRTVMPGLVDAHVHLTYTLETGESELRFFDPKDSPEYNVVKATRTAETYLENGITTVRDVGSRGNLATGIRDAVEDGVIPGPRVKASGPILCSTAGLADFYPSWLGAETNFMRRVDGVDEVIAATRELLRNRVDNVKMEASGEWISPYSTTKTPTMSEAEMAAAVGIAHDFGATTAVHCRSNEGMKRAVRAGVDTIEHGTYLDDELLEMLLESGTYVVSTLTQIKLFIERGLDAGMPEERVEELEGDYETHVENLRWAYEEGVNVVAGTDSLPPLVEHASTALEMANFVDIAGFDPMDGLMSGTSRSAAAIGFDDEVGSLEPGKYADVLVFDGDPLADLRELNDPANLPFVMKGGEVVRNGL